MSVCESISGTTRPIYINVFVHVRLPPMAVVWSCSDGTCLFTLSTLTVTNTPLDPRINYNHPTNRYCLHNTSRLSATIVWPTFGPELAESGPESISIAQFCFTNKSV